MSVVYNHYKVSFLFIKLIIWRMFACIYNDFNNELKINTFFIFVTHIRLKLYIIHKYRTGKNDFFLTIK